MSVIINFSSLFCFIVYIHAGSQHINETHEGGGIRSDGREQHQAREDQSEHGGECEIENKWENVGS